MKQCEIITGRLCLKPFTIDETDEIHRLWIDPDVRRYLWDDQVISHKQATEAVAESVRLYEQDGLGLWSVRLPDDESLAGFCGYWFFHDPPELQLLYSLAPTHWNKGLATEAARAMIRYGFEEKSFASVIASADAPNLASLQVLEKIGLRFEKRSDKNGLATVYYRLRRSEWQPDDSPYELRLLRK